MKSYSQPFGELPMMCVVQSMDGIFKLFVLETLFYRFISENFTQFIQAGDDSVDYINTPDDVVSQRAGGAGKVNVSLLLLRSQWDCVILHR